MVIYLPYFYIIRHIKTNKMYAGSRWAKNCNPKELLSENGYLTSSNIIKSIIDIEGVSAFDILRIDTYCDNLHPYEYESLFLKTNKCGESIFWFNSHNNDGICFGSSKFKIKYKENCKLKYGVSHMSQLESTKQAYKNTCLEKYGVDNYVKTSEFKELHREFNLNLIKEEKHHFTNSEWQRNNQFKRVLNGNHPFVGGKIQSISNKNRLENKTHNFLSEESRKKSSERAKQKHYCKYCNREIGGISNFKTYHGDNCKSKKI